MSLRVGSSENCILSDWVSRVPLWSITEDMDTTHLCALAQGLPSSSDPPLSPMKRGASIEDKTAIVTGASSGIGETIAEQYAADGANVAICSRQQENVDPVAERINDSDRPGQVIAIECDITDRDAVDVFVDRTIETFGGIDILVNNAGAGFVAPFDEITENGWQTIIDINLTGTYNCTHAARDALAGGGVVINFSSIAGQNGLAREVHYSTAKAGIINFTRTMAFEWAEKNVRVNCIAPGFIATDAFIEHWGVGEGDIDRQNWNRRIGTTEEIADIAYFLATPQSSFINGETITAEGIPRVEQSAEIPTLEASGP